MHPISTALNFADVFSAGLAAWYWYRSSQVLFPTILHGGALIGGRVDVATTPILKAVAENSRLNKVAAAWSAVAAAAAALSALAAIAE